MTRREERNGSRVRHGYRRYLDNLDKKRAQENMANRWLSVWTLVCAELDRLGEPVGITSDMGAYKIRETLNGCLLRLRLEPLKNGSLEETTEVLQVRLEQLRAMRP